MSHPTEDLITCCGVTAPIDVDLVPIVRPLWNAGIHTQGCCQGDGKGDASIMLPDIEEAEKFARFLIHRGVAPNDVTDWTWSIVPRFPLRERGLITIGIPRLHLVALADLLDGKLKVNAAIGEYVPLPAGYMARRDLDEHRPGVRRVLLPTRHRRTPVQGAAA